MIRKLLKIIPAGFFAAFLWSTVRSWWEYTVHPEIYEVNSAPWYYIHAVPSFVLFALSLAVCAALSRLIRKVNPDDPVQRPAG